MPFVPVLQARHSPYLARLAQGAPCPAPHIRYDIVALAAAAATASARQALPSARNPLQQGVPGYRLPAVQLPRATSNCASASPTQVPPAAGGARGVIVSGGPPAEVPQPENNVVLQGHRNGQAVHERRAEKCY